MSRTDPSKTPKLNLEATIRQALTGLCYGSVEIIVHNARVVQIERRERFRPEGGFEATESPTNIQI